MLAYGELLDLNCFLKFILMMIVPFLVFLVWAENKVPNSNNGEELVVGTSSEIDQLFEQDLEHMRHGALRAYSACSFCGKLSHITTTCSRCKAALFCSKVCHITHSRFWHKYECVESEADEDRVGSSPSDGTHLLLLESKKETEQGEVPYIKAKEVVESTDGTAKSQLAIVSGYDRCAVCGNPSTKKCSRCKAIKYCSKTCQHFDWRSGHNFHCVVEKENSAQEVPAHGNVVLPTTLYAVEDSVNSSGPLCMEFYSEGNTNAKALILRSREATRESQKEIEELVRSLNEELEMINSKTCQHFDWRSGHNFHCVVEKENSAQEVPAHGNVVLPTTLYAVEDSVNSSGPLCMEFYSEGNTNAKALILRSREATRESQKEIEELVRSLNEELEMIKKKNISLQSERDKWEKQARFAVDRLYSIRKENEHQMFVLKHENELISNAENQARKMLHSLYQRLHCLQTEREARCAESKKKEEDIHILQNECVKAKTELQEQKKCVQRLTMELDDVTQFPMRIAEARRQKFANALSSVSAAEFRTPSTPEMALKLDHPEGKITKPDVKVNFIPKEFQTISLSRNPTYTRQACAVCLTNEKDMAFGCGHMTCRDCGSKIRKCHICRKEISNRIRLFPG